MLKLILSIILPCIAFTSNSMLDLRMAVDPFDAKNRSHIDIVSQASYQTPYCSLLFNPEIAFFLNKSVDFGVSFGHRWEFPKGTLGHHIFIDRSQMPKISVNQIGTGVDFLTPKLDFRANYYHPISPSVHLKDRIVKPNKWIETEAMYKSPYFNVGMGPTMNIDNGVVGLQGRFIVPFERFSIGLGGLLDVAGEKQGFLITSFHLYRDKTGNISNTPMSHTKRPKIEFIPIKTSKSKKDNEAKDHKEKFDEKDLIPAEDNEKNFEETVDQFWEEKLRDEVTAPIDVPAPEDKSVWDSILDFFLKTRNG